MARGRPSKKSHIVEAACELFTKQGYQSTRIDQVVLTAAVSKPTVYSNFPTKLVLWETALSALTERAQEEMGQALSSQNTTADSDFVAGWIALWSEWIGKPERLASYRILLGEQHKMAPSTFALFAEFEAVLESTLLAWMTVFSVPNERFFILKAVSKEAFLTPALMNQTITGKDELRARLETLSY